MSADQIINIKLQYDVRGIDSSIRQSQRLLYFMNAVRLSVADMQQVMSGPTVANIMWTAVQLTRVWTTAYRWVRMTNEAQRIGIAQGALGGVGGRAAGGRLARATGVMGVNQAMNALFDPTWQAPGPGFMASLMATLSNPLVAGALIGGTILLGAAVWDRNQRLQHMEWQRRNREMAKSQGLEG